MAPFNNINPFDRDFAAHNSTVQQPQQQQVDFEQQQEHQAGQAGQEQFQRHLGEARRANAAIPAPGIVVLPDPFHPHLSQEDLSLIDAAVQAYAPRRELRSKTVQNYIKTLRTLGNYLGSKGKTIEGLGHDSLIAIADAVFPKRIMGPALQVLRKYRERSAPAVQADQGPVDEPARGERASMTSGSRQDGEAAAPPVPTVNEEQIWRSPDAVGTTAIDSVLATSPDELQGPSEDQPSSLLSSDPDLAESFRRQGWRHNHHQGTGELTDALVRTSLPPGEEVLINGGQDTADMRPAKRQRTFNNPQGVAIERQLSDGKSGGRVLIQAPIHHVGASPWEARPMMQGSGHEYILAPHGEGGGAMPEGSALQPGQSIGVYLNGSGRPLYSEDASLVLGLEEGIIGSNGEHLLSLGRWLFENNKPGIAARLYDESLTQDVEEFERNGGASSVITALARLKAFQSAPPIVRRSALNPYPDDVALIEAYKAAPAEGIIQDTVSGYAKRLRRFADHLRKNNKPTIAARLYDKSLDKDATDFKESGGLGIGAALAHVRKSLPRAGALELGQHSARVPHPEQAVARRVGDAAARHSGSEGAVSWPEILLPTERHDQDVVSGMIDEADPSSQGSGHEYIQATHAGGDGSMHSAVQPDRPIVVPDGRDKRPLYFNDATAIEGLRSALRASKAKESTVTRKVNALFGFSRWLLQTNRPGFAARLDHPSLNQDLKDYESTGGSSTVAGVLCHLKKSAGGAAPMVGRAALNPDPDDAALIRNYRAALIRDAAAQHSAPQEALSWPEELTAEGYDQDLLRGMMDEAILASSLEPTVRDHQASDFGGAVRHLSRRDGYQPAPHELTGSDPLPRHEVLMGEDYTGQLTPANSQRTLSNRRGHAIGRQLSEAADSAARVLVEDAGPPSPSGPTVGSPLVLPAEGYDQDLLWAMMEDAGPSSSLEPTALHHQAPDFGEAVRPLNWRHGDQHAPDELIATLDGSSVLPSQDSRPTSFVINGDRHTALLVPAGVTRQSTPLNQPGAAIRLNYRPENAPQPSARPRHRALPELLARRMEQAMPVSDKAETALGETFDASLAVPGGFPHGTQPAPETMLPEPGRWGVLPVKRYDVRGERETALLGPGGPEDVQLIHHARVGSHAVPAAPARDPSNIYSGLASLVDLTTAPQELGDKADYPSMIPRAPSDAQIGASGPTASLAGHRELELGAREWLGDKHINRDYALLQQELQRDNPNLAARTRFVDPLIALYRLRVCSDSVARATFEGITHENGEDTADFLFLPVNNASAGRGGSHWSLLFIDRRDRERPVAYHYDSIGTTNGAIAAELVEKLGVRLEPARIAQQQNGYDCGVFVVDGTRALVGRLAQGERPEHEPLHLDNLVADRRALQDRLRG